MAKFQVWAIATCNGCNRIVARTEYPARRGWILDQHKLDRTVVTCTDSIALKGKTLQPCVCTKVMEDNSE